MITSRFRSAYRGVATYDVFGVDRYPGALRVEHFYWTREEYRADWRGGEGWNYTLEEYERDRVLKAGGYYLYFGQTPASDEVIRVIQGISS